MKKNVSVNYAIKRLKPFKPQQGAVSKGIYKCHSCAMPAGLRRLTLKLQRQRAAIAFGDGAQAGKQES